MFDKQSMQETLQNMRKRLPRLDPSQGNRIREQLRELVAAIRFLTIIPIPGSAQLFSTDAENEVDLVIGSAYFPLVGLLLATLLYLLVLVFSPFMPTLVMAALVIVVQIILTGGLHLDGLMDTCDGLFGGGTIQHKLDIMQDSRVGSFGVLGAFCLLLLRFVAFASMPTHLLIIALFMVLPVARWAMLLTVSLFPTTRLGGLGSTFRHTVTRLRLIIGGITALIVVLIAGHLAGLLVLLIGTLVAVAMGAMIARKLGGLTGDTYGAIEEVTEVILLLLIILVYFWF